MSGINSTSITSAAVFDRLITKDSRCLELRVLEELESTSDLGRKWEELVASSSSSGIMQSIAWRDVKKRQGLVSHHVGLFIDDQLVGGCIFYMSRKRNGLGILVGAEGPVLPWKDQALSSDCLKLIFDHTQRVSHELGIMAVRIEPRLASPAGPAFRECLRAPVDLVPRETLYVDLSQSESALLSAMKPKGRYNIKLSNRNGVRIVEDQSTSNIDRFYNVLQEASVRDGFALEPIPFFRSMAEVLLASGHARFLFAEHEGDILGTLLLTTYGDRATYLYGGITNSKRNLMGGYALQWRAMQIAKSLGCKFYDFYGYDAFRSSEHNYARFSQFKSQFGGEAVTFMGGHDYFFMDNLADAFIKVVQEIEPEQSKSSLETAVQYEPVGTHLLLTLKGCSSPIINDPDALRAVVNEACLATNATVLELVAHRFQPQGATVVAVLAESHASLHTYPESNTVFWDCFTCGPTCKPELSEAVLVKALCPTEINRQLVSRD